MFRYAVFGKGESSKLLAKALNTKRNVRRGARVGINYGSTQPLNCEYVLNHPNAVKRSSHKYNSLQCFRDAGLNTPDFDLDFNRLRSRVSPDTIIFGRKFYHSKGNDILYFKEGVWYNVGHVPINDTRTLSAIDYYVARIPKFTEYRYHIFEGKCILPTKKMLGDGRSEGESIIRNHQDGLWTQVACKETERFTEACVRGLYAHGLDFGAVDFLYVKSTDTVYLLEINTQVGLSVENRLTAYRDAIANKLNEIDIQLFPEGRFN